MNLINLKRICATAVAVWTMVFLQCQSAAAEEAAQPGPNAIEQVEFSQISGQTLIKVTLRSPLSRAPEPYTLYSPKPRLFFDFVDTENASGVTQKTAALSDLQSLNVVKPDREPVWF